MRIRKLKGKAIVTDPEPEFFPPHRSIGGPIIREPSDTNRANPPVQADSHPSHQNPTITPGINTLEAALDTEMEPIPEEGEFTEEQLDDMFAELTNTVMDEELDDDVMNMLENDDLLDEEMDPDAE
ncbi:unnamed protein product [Microthlaspi erraticum]|uniref:Uncharacterized protein n=1 Tax=Microthlaspi erraticum TaxID=1685480 RepID=A0A6D2J3D5_9BRAS|nr:unnamed protein product [Microthlaspi erraticum]